MIQRMKEIASQDEEVARNEGGFTLIELLVVIIILGILAAVVVFAVGGVGDKGQSAACVIDTRTIRTAEEAYFANNGAYAAEATLVPSFMSQASTYHDVTPLPVGGPFTSFQITVQAAASGNPKCGTTAGDIVGTTAGAL